MSINQKSHWKKQVRVYVQQQLQPEFTQKFKLQTAKLGGTQLANLPFPGVIQVLRVCHTFIASFFLGCKWRTRPECWWSLLYTLLLLPPQIIFLSTFCLLKWFPASCLSCPFTLPLLRTTNPNSLPSLSSNPALPLLLLSLLPTFSPSPHPPNAARPSSLILLFSLSSFSFCLLPPFFLSSPLSLSGLPINSRSLWLSEVMSCEINCGVFVCFWRHHRITEGKSRNGLQQWKLDWSGHDGQSVLKLNRLESNLWTKIVVMGSRLSTQKRNIWNKPIKNTHLNAPQLE